MKPQPRRDAPAITEAEARAMLDAWEREPPVVDVWPEHDPDEDERALRRAEEDIAAGRVIDGDVVLDWLAKKVRGENPPLPKCPGE